MGRCLSQTCFSLFIFSVAIILCLALYLLQTHIISSNYTSLSPLCPSSPPPLFSPFPPSFFSFNLFPPALSPFHPCWLPPFSLSVHPSSSLAIFPLRPSLCVSASIRGKWKKWHQLFGKRREMEGERDTEEMKRRIEKWKTKIKRVTLGMIVNEGKGKQETEEEWLVRED